VRFHECMQGSFDLAIAWECMLCSKKHFAYLWFIHNEIPGKPFHAEASHWYSENPQPPSYPAFI
jgi:hypothetical protein